MLLPAIETHVVSVTIISVAVTAAFVEAAAAAAGDEVDGTSGGIVDGAGVL